MTRLTVLVELAEKFEPLVSITELNVDDAEAKEVLESIDLEDYEEKLREKCKDFIIENYTGWDTLKELEEKISNDIATLRENAHESWGSTINRLETEFFAFAKTYGSKSKTRRQLERHAPWASIVIVLTVYFSIRLFSAVQVTDGIQETQGFLQHHNAFEKVLRYDDWMDTRVRRGGIFKSLIFWPIKPSDDEVLIASKYLVLVVEISDYLQSAGKICPTQQLDFSDDLLTASFFSDYLSEQKYPHDKIEEKNSIIFIGDALTRIFPCQSE